MSQVVMTDNQLFYSWTDSSLFDTYLVYGLIGVLIFIALTGLIILLTTSYCCLYCYLCCYRRHRQSSYKLNENLGEQEDTKKISFINSYSNDRSHFSQFCHSSPHLINHNPIITIEMNNENLNTSCSTINTLVTPMSPRHSSGNDLANSSKPTIHHTNTTKDHIKNSRRSTPLTRSLFPPRISTSGNDPKHSPCTNIYETVVPMTTMNSSATRSIPIYETQSSHHLKQPTVHRKPSIELPSLSSSSGLIASNHYFQQVHPYDKFLANRIKASDSMRRSKILTRIKDDAAFLY